MSTIATMTAENIQLMEQNAALQLQVAEMRNDIDALLQHIKLEDTDEVPLWHLIIAEAKKKYPTEVDRSRLGGIYKWQEENQEGTYKWQEQNQQAGQSTIV
jgi:hypothetical protein